MNHSLLVVIAAIFAASPLYAQDNNRLHLDASFTRGTVGYARNLDAKLYAGIEIGFGFPQLDRTFVPEQDSLGSPDFREYLHVGIFVRAVPSPNFELDAGARASLADLWPCGASDCWPLPFAGAYLQPMVGWRRLKFGPRLTAGVMFDGKPGRNQEETTFVVGLNPFTARYSIPW